MTTLNTPLGLDLILRTKEAVSIQSFLSSTTSSNPSSSSSSAVVSFKEVSSTHLVKSFEGTGIDGSSSYQTSSPDGSLVAITDKEGVDLYSLHSDSRDSTLSNSGGVNNSTLPYLPTLRCRIPIHAVSALEFSPRSSYLVTWNRKKGEEPNLLVWDTRLVSSGSEIPLSRLCACFHFKVYTPDTWPPLQWSADERICARVANDEIQLFDGKFASSQSVIDGLSGGGAGPTPLHKIPCNGVQKVFVSTTTAAAFRNGSSSAIPGKGKGEDKTCTLVAFCPRTKSRPGCVSLWAYPKLAEPACSKSLQADGCQVSFSPDSALALVEMSTSSSAESYYGDSRLFLLSRDGKVNTSISPPKEGPTHDFAWSPDGNNFIVIAGNTPPGATLYNKTGAAVFSFGAAAHNTVKISPNGKVAVLCGFGNMAGNLWFWDIEKFKLLGPMSNAPCTVHADWAPDSRHFLTSTTRPRLQVDNGFKIWNYHGVCVLNKPMEFLYLAEWRPRPRGAVGVPIYPDRSPSPLPLALSSSSSASHTDGGLSAALPPKAIGVYRPPGAKVGANAIAAAAIMKEAYVPSGKISQTGSSTVAVSQVKTPVVTGRIPIGGTIVAVEEGGQSKRAKQRAKKRAEKLARGEMDDGEEEEEEREVVDVKKKSESKVEAIVSSAASMSIQTVSVVSKGGDEKGADSLKELRAIEKKLKAIAELEQRDVSTLNADQVAKIGMKKEFEEQKKRIEDSLN